jgi:hypothetical protein
MYDLKTYRIIRQSVPFFGLKDIGKSSVSTTCTVHIITKVKGPTFCSKGGLKYRLKKHGIVENLLFSDNKFSNGKLYYEVASRIDMNSEINSQVSEKPKFREKNAASRRHHESVLPGYTKNQSRHVFLFKKMIRFSQKNRDTH